MALPVDAGRAVTNSAVSGLSHALNLPGSIAANDILVAIVRAPAATTITWPAGWVEMEESVADASDDSTSIAYKIATGAEGATATITLGTARVLVGYCVRVTGGVSVSVSAGVVGSATQPDSPSYSPSGIAQDALWISLGGCDDSRALTSGPASYANATLQGSTLTGITGCTVFGATRGLNAAVENPGAWTLGTTSIWTAWTVHVSSTVLPIRVSQDAVDVLVEPTTQKVRISQEAVDVVVRPQNKLRVSQEAVDVVVKQAAPKLRTSQLAVDVVVKVSTTKMRMEQLAVDVLIEPPPPPHRVSQVAVDVLMKKSYDEVTTAWYDIATVVPDPVHGDG